ncbi:hypothetical protein XAC3810_10035 [Xanthomonas citri pv. citri]|uniref:Uncharacterized protein n=1 Tax=Xanthomonas citri pv. citri TaxID=611301 RepID=A0A0U5BNM9_XANCI|nr:hypothetical protein XAC3824_10033 [Xanthomonas citri pv. citri]CEE16113.1 hypothetical protein XAC9322_10035 [Xanthomonas citri pv. citri]CEE16153.1 hypothetical protein XAC1083_10035 [Xanthomonas citri pv. citri]CEE16887.1 hypothetical protein XAC902_10035 [Xanthomonas citri pv. citri]CEE21479.1 hypothetical protein XAC3810_10035 [Xanthomonas citri pv. citri]
MDVDGAETTTSAWSMPRACRASLMAARRCFSCCSATTALVKASAGAAKQSSPHITLLSGRERALSTGLSIPLLGRFFLVLSGERSMQPMHAPWAAL